MKTAILFIVAIISSAIQSPAQCILLKVNLNDCALCTAHSSFFNPLKTGLPAYAIYPTSSRVDSVDLEYLGKFSENNIRIIFNDKWNEKLYCDNSLSCAFGLNREGEIVYSSPLKSLNRVLIDSFLLNNKSIRSSNKLQHDSLLYTKNYLGVIKIHNTVDNRLVRTIRCTDFDLQLLADKMPDGEKKRFKSYGEIINRKTRQFLAQFTNIQLSENGDLLVKLSYHSTLDSLTAKSITDEFAIIHYDAHGNYKDVYLIEESEDFFLDDFSFLQANQDTVYLVIRNNTKSGKPKEPDYDMNFIGRFVKKGGNYKFSDYVPYNLPYIYQAKYHYNFLSSAFSHYPLVVNRFSNDVYNIKTNKTVFIIDSMKYVNGIENIEFDPRKSINTDEKLEVCGLAPVFGQPKLYSLPYIYDSNFFIAYYTEDLTKKYTYCWGKATIAGKAIVSARGIKGKDQISIIYVGNDKTWTSLALPMSLFLAES